MNYLERKREEEAEAAEAERKRKEHWRRFREVNPEKYAKVMAHYAQKWKKNAKRAVREASKEEMRKAHFEGRVGPRGGISMKEYKTKLKSLRS